MNFENNFKNKNIIITGGTRGIGLAIAKAFAKEKANLSICASSDKDYSDIIKELNSLGASNVFISKCDVSDYSSCEAFANAAIDQLGAPYALINNAGITDDNLMLKMSTESFNKVINVNLGGAFNMTKAIMKPMIKQKEGRLIFLSSIMGIQGNAGQANYAASKAGIIALMKSVAKEVGRRGITSNAIAPGYIKTEMTASLPEELKEKMLDKQLIKRLGEGEDIANACVFLASDNASYITGQTLVIDGGLMS